MYNLVSSNGAKFRLTQTGNATFAGTINSGAITSTGAFSATTGAFTGNVTISSGHKKMLVGGAGGSGHIGMNTVDDSDNAYMTISAADEYAGWARSGTIILYGKEAGGRLTLIGGAGTDGEIQMETGGSNTLVLDTDKSATFAGLVNVGTTTNNGKIHIRYDESSGREPMINFDSAANNGEDHFISMGSPGTSNTLNIGWRNNTNGFCIARNSNDDLQSGEQFQIGPTGITTFSGKVNMTYGGLSLGTTASTGGGSPNFSMTGTNPYINLTESDTSAQFHMDLSSSNLFHVLENDGEQKFYVNNALQLTIDSSSATFTGDVQLTGGLNSLIIGASSGEGKWSFNNAAFGIYTYLSNAGGESCVIAQFDDAYSGTYGGHNPDGDFMMYNYSDSMYFAQDGNKDIHFWTNNAERFRISGAGVATFAGNVIAPTADITTVNSTTLNGTYCYASSAISVGVGLDSAYGLKVRGKAILNEAGGVNTYGHYKGYDNDNHFITMRGIVSGTSGNLTITGGHQATWVEYCSPHDSTTGWFFKDSSVANYPTIARISDGSAYFNGTIGSGAITSTGVIRTLNEVQIDHPSANADIHMYTNGTHRFSIESTDSSAGYQYISTKQSNGALWFRTGVHTEALVLDSSQNAKFYGNVLPSANNSKDLGSPSYRFANVYAGDLHLKNETGDWTVVEGEEELFLHNNLTGKKYAIMMREVE